jgi:hypothetical protein
MQTLKQVINQPSERENLRALGICTAVVCGFVFLAFILLAVASLVSSS